MGRVTNRLIFHVDINSYFATMLQQENPRLRGKPVGVVKGKGRGCIIASSNEAKKLGVGTGNLVRDAKLRAPNIILVPAHLDLMLSSTRKLKALFETLSPDVDVFSLDEAFLDLTGADSVIEQILQDATIQTNDSLYQAYGRHIQRCIKKTLGEWVQCNVGISHNKLLAKLAGEVGKKGDVFQIYEQNLDTVLSQASFRDVCGIGVRLEAKLKALGITNPYQINFIDDATLLSCFGPHWAVELRKIGRGEETHFFHTRRGGYLAKNMDYQKSVGRTITGYTLVSDEMKIKQILLNLLEEATHKLRAMDLVGRKIGVSLWGHDIYWGNYITLKYWVRHTDEIWKLILTMLSAKTQSFPVIKFGVWIGECMPFCDTPQPLLHAWYKRENLYQAMDGVNKRFGYLTVKPAALLGGKIIKPEVTGYLGDKIYLGL